MSTTIQTKWNGRAYYIEPNHFTKAMNETVNVETTQDLEDYCIFCDLDVEISSKVTNYSTKVIRAHWVSHVNNDTSSDNGKISWLGGKNYGNIKVLSDSYTDVSYKTVQDNEFAKSPDTELFGINSVTINYDSWTTPTVHMKFTDIRGMSLFSPEEYAHPTITADGTSGQNENVDMTGSFFRAFFTFPYPRFKLYVKGYYGHPICYDLAVNKFNASFDANTGNFGADVDFVGFKFGLLNDVTMTSLASAVVSKAGANYWNQQVGNGRFKDNGKELYRVSWLAYIWGQMQGKLNALDDAMSERQNQLAADETRRNTEKEKLKDIWSTFNTWMKDCVIKSFSDIAEHNKSYYGTSTSNKTQNAQTTQNASTNSYNWSATDKKISLKTDFGYDASSYPVFKGEADTSGIKSDGTTDTGDTSYGIANLWVFDSCPNIVQPVTRYANRSEIRQKYYLLSKSSRDSSLQTQERCGMDGDKIKKDVDNVSSGNYPWVQTPFKYNSTFYSFVIDLEGNEDKFETRVPYKDTSPTVAQNDAIKVNTPKQVKVDGHETNSQIPTFKLSWFSMVEPKSVVNPAYNAVDKTDVLKNTFVTDVIRDEITSSDNTGSHWKYYTDTKGPGKYFKICSDFNTLIESVGADSDEGKDYAALKKLFQDNCSLNNLCPIFENTKYVIYPKVHKIRYWIDEYKNVHKDDNGKDISKYGTTSLYTYLSHYKFNATPFVKAMKNIMFHDDAADQEALDDEKRRKAEEIKNSMQIDGGLRFVLKSLWAHVETFLYLCNTTKDNIIANPRTPNSLGLTKENSSLPRICYEKPDTEKIPPFPSYITTEGEDAGGTRQVYKYIGADHSDLEECKLIEELIYGASQFYNFAKEGERNSDGSIKSDLTTVYNQSYDEIKLGLYNYLQNFFDKWMYSLYSVEDSLPNDSSTTDKMQSDSMQSIQAKWGVDSYFDKHFIFIDTWYNKIGNEIGVDRDKLCESCKEIFEHKNNTLMTFITNLLQNINTILVPTQGFMLNDITNGEKPMQYYDKLFTPIPFSDMKKPESEPYFVAIYRGDPSKHLDTGPNDEDDGFMISMDDSVSEYRPLGLVNKSTDNGYIIPAIGVSYGMQYQSYFNSIEPTMNVQMANEVVLATQFHIAGVSVENNSGNYQTHDVHLGQDLYTVYANNSYTCSVSMLGCMWIQPLMYFQLNNIPMYRGTYMIQKVSHEISPGNMVTKFTGVRMSRFSSPFVNKYVAGGSSDGESAFEEARHHAAAFDNDCPYKIYDPNAGANATVFTEEWLNSKFSEIFPYHKSDIDTWYNAIKDKTVKLGLASVIIKEDSGTELSMKLHAVVMYNALYANLISENSKARKGGYVGGGHAASIYASDAHAYWRGGNWCALKDPRTLPDVLDFITNENHKKRTTILNAVDEIFTKSPLCLKGLKTDHNDDLTEDVLSRLCGTMAISSSANHTSKDIRESGTKFSLDDKGYHFWTAAELQSHSNASSTDTDNKFADRLIECIQKTFNYYNGLNGENFDSLFRKPTITEKETKIVFVVKENEFTFKTPLLLDILFNANGEGNSYHKYISSITCSWKGTGVSKTTYPQEITIIYKEEGDVTATALTFQSDKQTFVIQKETMPEEFYQILKKKETNLQSTEALDTYVKNKFENK